MHLAELNPYECPVCGQVSRKSLNRTGNRKPRAGDLSICHRCAAVSVFTPALTLRQATEVELVNLYAGNLGPLACEIRDKILHPR